MSTILNIVLEKSSKPRKNPKLIGVSRFLPKREKKEINLQRMMKEITFESLTSIKEVQKKIYSDLQQRKKVGEQNKGKNQRDVAKIQPPIKAIGKVWRQQASEKFLQKKALQREKER